MSRLIDADALIERFRERAGCRGCNNWHGVKCERVCNWGDAIGLADEAPTVETKKVYHGYWVEEPDRENHWHCSRCEAVQGVVCKAMRYCPDCGAEMDVVR